MKNTAQRKKKESFVVFEDWMKYARCLNDVEFRQLMNNILNYYKNQEPVLNTPMLVEVWNDIIDDLEINVNKKQAKRDTMLRNSLSNPKLSIVPNTIPDIGSNIEPNTTLNIAGMGDGRWDMEDDLMEDEEWKNEEMNDEPMVNEKYQIIGEYEDGLPIIQSPVSKSSIERSEEFDRIFAEFL